MLFVNTGAVIVIANAITHRTVPCVTHPLCYLIAGAQGGLSGVLSVTGIGVVGQAIGNALISASGSALNGDDLITTIDNAIVGALAGAAGGPGTGYGGLCFSSTLRNKRLMASFLKSLLRSSAVSNTATIVKQIKKAIEVLEQEGNATSK